MTPRVIGTVLAAGLVACRAGTRAPPPPISSRPVVDTCDRETLRAFDPGVDGVEQIAISQRTAGAAPARTRAWPCETRETDAACVARVRGRAEADPAARVDAVEVTGEPDGWSVTLEVDGRPRVARFADQDALFAEGRRLQAAGHTVVLLEGHTVLRAAGRRAVVSYAPDATRLRWQAELRWPTPSDPTAAFARLRDRLDGTALVLVRYAAADGTTTVVLACP